MTQMLLQVMESSRKLAVSLIRIGHQLAHHIRVNNTGICTVQTLWIAMTPITLMNGRISSINL